MSTAQSSSDKTVRTIYGSYVQNTLLMKTDFTLAANTTFNEYFDVQSGVAPDSGVYPSARYIAIGRGGHTMKTGADGEILVDYLKHLASDAMLYKPLPFVLRTTDNDLTATERANYAIRKTMTVKGVTYYAYYLRRFDVTALKTNMQYNTVVNGSTTVTRFVPTTDNLHPTSSSLSATGVTSTSGDYLNTSTVLDLVLDESAVSEILNAAKIIYGNEAYAFISELAIVTGVDKVVQGSLSNGATFNYTEAIAAQVHTFISVSADLQGLSEGFEVSIDVGSTEPLGVK